MPESWYHIVVVTVRRVEGDKLGFFVSVVLLTLLECDPQARPQGSRSLLGAASSWIRFACPLFPLFSKTNCDKSLQCH